MFSYNVSVPNFEFYLETEVVEHLKKVTSNYLGNLYSNDLLNSFTCGEISGYSHFFVRKLKFILKCELQKEEYREIDHYFFIKSINIDQIMTPKICTIIDYMYMCIHMLIHNYTYMHLYTHNYNFIYVKGERKHF